MKPLLAVLVAHRPPSCCLNDVASENISCIARTLETSHALKFALLLRRQMIEFGAHYWTFSKHLEWLHPRIPAGAPAHERKRSSALFMWVSCRTIEGLCQGYAGG